MAKTAIARRPRAETAALIREAEALRASVGRLTEDLRHERERRERSEAAAREAWQFSRLLMARPAPR